MLKQVPRGLDTWAIYHALLQPYEALGGRAAIEAVNPKSLHLAARLVAAQSIAADDPEDSDIPVQVRRSVQRLVQDAIMADATEGLMEP